jgi:hypothetical protein
MLEKNVMENSANPLVRRCPRLGGAVGFGYCLHGEPDRPCFKIVDCWWETFDIVRYLEDHLDPEQLKRLMSAQPKPKISSLIELAQQARKCEEESE